MKTEDNDPVEPTVSDRDRAVSVLKLFDLHGRVDVVEFVSLAIKHERDRCTEIFIAASDAQMRLTQSAEREIEQLKAQGQREIPTFDVLERERYPDALFQAEDLLRQVKLLKAKVERLVDESGFDASRAESAELERDRAKAEVQRAEQERDEAQRSKLFPNEDFVERETIICSAIRLEDGRIFRGHRHSDCIQVAHYVVTYAHEHLKGLEWKCPYGEGQGFISSKNRYVTREEGLRLQKAAGIESVAEGGYRGKQLFSEDLY